MCNTTETAQSLAHLHAKHVWAHEGLPWIHSFDWGPQFNAEYTKELYKKLGIKHRLSTAYHPQSQGQVENLNGWLETYLWMFIGHHQDNWVDHLHTAQFMWNNHYHASIGMTPFFASWICHLQMTDVTPSSKDLHTRQDHQKATNKLVTHMINKAQQAQKWAYDRWKNDTPQLQPGDHVWLETTHLLTDCPLPKPDWKWIRPLSVAEQSGPLTYQLHLPSSYKIHNVFHISLLTLVKEDCILGCTVPPPDPITIIQEGEKVNLDIEEQYYIMEWYVNSQQIINTIAEWEFQFKVKWDGYNVLTWETHSRLNEDAARMNQQYLQPGDDDFNMEEDFYERHPDAPHHDDPISEQVNALGRWQTVHRCKGKASIRPQWIFWTAGCGYLLSKSENYSPLECLQVWNPWFRVWVLWQPDLMPSCCHLNGYQSCQPASFQWSCAQLKLAWLTIQLLNKWHTKGTMS